MNSPYCELVEEIASLVPPLDRDGFREVLEMVDARLLAIADRPPKHSFRLALHSLCKAKANMRLAELGMANRF